MRRARKEWNGGKPPELNHEGKALVEHMERCEHCLEYPLQPCLDGRRLHEQFDASLKRPAPIPRQIHGS